MKSPCNGKLTLFSFAEDNRKERLSAERRCLLLSMEECLYEGDWERVGDEMDALLEIGTVCEDGVSMLAGHDSIVRIDSRTEVVSASVSLTIECVLGCRLTIGGAIIIGGGIGNGSGESG